jgi:hypothetical protein
MWPTDCFQDGVFVEYVTFVLESQLGITMDRGMKQVVRGGMACLGILALIGCAAPPAKDFGGRWRPVNQFQSAPERIQLKQPYVFYASPLDGTLKNMLARWATDAGYRLVYKLPYDYTLYAPVSAVRSRNLADAVARLSTIYSDEHVAITAVDREIIVEAASSSSSATSTDIPAMNVSAGGRKSAEVPPRKAN